MDVPVTLWVAAHATCLPADEFFVLRSVDAARSGAVRSDAVVIVVIMVFITSSITVPVNKNGEKSRLHPPFEFGTTDQFGHDQLLNYANPAWTTQTRSSRKPSTGSR